MNDMFAMGGYGAYVWSCFGITLLVLVICVVQGRAWHNRTLKEIGARLRAMESKS